MLSGFHTTYFPHPLCAASGDTNAEVQRFTRFLSGNRRQLKNGIARNFWSELESCGIKGFLIDGVWPPREVRPGDLVGPEELKGTDWEYMTEVLLGQANKRRIV